MNKKNCFSAIQLFYLIMTGLCLCACVILICMHLFLPTLIGLAGLMLFYGLLIGSECQGQMKLENQLERVLKELAAAKETIQNTPAAKPEARNKASVLSPVTEQSSDSAPASVTEQTSSPVSTAAESVSTLLPPIHDGDAFDTVNIIDIASETIDELQVFAQKAGIDIRLTKQSDNIYVKANRERLHIMFRNIIDNSIKYMGRRGLLQVTLSSIGDDLFIILKDNGFGLSVEETPHIFELNYQGSNRISGNGLGLTQSKAIVEYYGGTIYARSNHNGMGIYIQLPTNQVSVAD